MNFTGAAKIAGVIGYPIKHSLSPKMHNYWLKEYSIDGVYIPMEVKPENLEKVVIALPLLGVRGCNLTVPHKELVLNMVDELSDVAKHIGAANTLIFENGKIKGTNTDAYGFIYNIKNTKPGFDFTKGHAVVAGAGGAARAVCAGLLEEGVPKIYLTNRTKEKAEKIRDHISQKIEVIDWEKREEVLSGAILLVNTTTLGMVGYPDLELRLDDLPKSALVTDIVYKPLETTLLQNAKKRGNIVVDGIGMLLHQAVPGFEAWFGKKPEVTDTLRDIMLKG